MELSNYLVSWVVTYLGELQPTYIGVIIYLLSTMDILVGIPFPTFVRDPFRNCRSKLSAPAPAAAAATVGISTKTKAGNGCDLGPSLPVIPAEVNGELWVGSLGSFFGAPRHTSKKVKVFGVQ